VVTVALFVGGYLYLRLDDEISRYAKQVLADHYQDLNVRVGRARLQPGEGITFHDVSLKTPQTGGPPQALVSIDELFLKSDTKIEALISGKPHVEQLVLRRPRLRVIRLADGRWNLQSLLPLPKFGEHTPAILIEDATLLIEEERATAEQDMPRLELRGVEIALTPLLVEGQATGRFQVQGVVTGSPAQEIRFSG